MEVNLDRYGGPRAWDVLCADIDDEVEKLRCERPGCSECSNYVPCPCGCGAGWCIDGGDFSLSDEPACEYERFNA